MHHTSCTHRNAPKAARLFHEKKHLKCWFETSIINDHSVISKPEATQSLSFWRLQVFSSLNSTVSGSQSRSGALLVVSSWLAHHQVVLRSARNRGNMPRALIDRQQSFLVAGPFYSKTRWPISFLATCKAIKGINCTFCTPLRFQQVSSVSASGTCNLLNRNRCPATTCIY